MRLDYNKQSYCLKIYFLEVHMGNNAIVGQSGGPTSVINASLAGVFQACVMRGANRVYGMLNGVAGLLDDRVTDLTATLGSSLEIELLKRTPSSYLGSCRYKLPDSLTHPDVYEKLFAILKKLDIGYFFYIGGNDSMDTICKLSDYAKRIGSDIRFMGVPKTIDNDLMHTDHTPGYGSAAKYIGTTIKELVRDSTIYDLKSVTIVEIMGRNAGWLTAAAALAEDEDCEGAAMICLPEIPFDPDHFIARVDAIQQQTPSLVVAVSEGVHIADGRYVCELAHTLVNVDAFGHTYLSGTAHYLSSLVAAKLHSKTRAVELSTLQRCAAHVASETDVSEAFGVGAFAVDAAFSGKTGMMAALKRVSDAPYACGFELHDIHDIANLEKKIPLDWIDAEHYRLREPFFAYARPLIAEEVKPEYQKGLPRHLKLKR